MELEEFKAAVDAWLDEHQRELACGYEGIGTLDEHMAQLRKVMRLAYDAGFMRWGWPERVGGLGGSNLLRAYLGEALTARDLVEPGIYSMPEVLAPTMIDYAPPTWRPRWCRAACGARRPGARASPSRARAATSPRSPAGPRGRTRAGGSTARRSGRAWPSTRNAACSSPAPARPSRPTAASPPCSSTWTAPASPCGPSRPCTARREFCEVFYDDVLVPLDRVLGEVDHGWAIAMDLLPFERSTALWHRAAYLQRRLQQLVAVAPAGALDPSALGQATELLWAFRARSRATQRRLAAGETLGPETSIDKVLVATAEQAVFDLVAEGLGAAVAIGDDPASGRWRAEFLYSRAATIYGGTAEIQRNIIARRLLDLGADR